MSIDLVKLCRDILMAPYCADCPKCEDGVIESLVTGSASKTEFSFCSCPRGRERLEEYE